ncbi:DNA repair protein RecO [Tissierella creatinophila]|uniref:DNA repair protein RecO n=1 Tax=Tissierella creatinophila DSM 6911 TaxID=1123403 RepID=A0A1U7M838_TISCR|nr:DNA repair protein RecO [Tissierella creatinophila]OLS03368.1 DNA repair protein RecO [Tissierella creatinophila DSM 6911]
MIKTEGIVLSEMRFKDTSKILNIYTKNLGKIPVMAKGAYKANSRLMGSTQVFSYNEYILKKGQTFYYLNQGNIIESFYNMRENVERFVYGSYILELIEKSSPEEEENLTLFLLLEKSLKILSELNDGFLKFIVAFQLKFVSFIGYKPHLNTCVSCNKTPISDIRWSNIEGGIICSSCFSKDMSSIYINKHIYKAMIELLYIPFEELENINISLKTLKSMQSLLERYILFNIDRKEFNSFKMIDMILEN